MKNLYLNFEFFFEFFNNFSGLLLCKINVFEVISCVVPYLMGDEQGLIDESNFFFNHLC